MPEDWYITRDQLLRRLRAARIPRYPDLGLEGPLRSLSEIVEAAVEILERRIVPVLGRRRDKLTRERIEHLLPPEGHGLNLLPDWPYAWRWFGSSSSMVHADNDIFLDVVINLFVFLTAMAEAGFPLAELTGGDLTDALDIWAWQEWGPDFERMPGRVELLLLARKEVSFNATRDDIRNLRRLLPEKLRRGGAPTHRTRANYTQRPKEK
jgi:hypothetical protein